MNKEPLRFHTVAGAVLACAALLISATQSLQAHAMRAINLRCEFRSDPIGIDTPRPRLSWTLEAHGRGASQTAYRILVASVPERLEREEGDLWDSGKMPSDRTSMIEYAGRAMRSHEQAFWKVMVWDGDGNAGGWSTRASWAMGILQPDEWCAQWIGYDAPRREEMQPLFATARWIWLAADTPFSAPAGRRYFGRILELPAGKRIAAADLGVTADNRFTLFINGKEAAASVAAAGAWKTPKRMDAAPFLIPGKNVLYVEAENAQAGPAGLLFWLHVRLADGSTQTLVSDRSWLSTNTPVGHWRTEGPREKEGAPSEALGNVGIPPWGILDGSFLRLPPPRHMGTILNVAQPVRRAVLYAAALGLCDVSINNLAVSDDYFTSGWTDYSKRVYYRAYDVTKLLREGTNSLGALLADGWYSGYVGWGAQRDHYGTKTRLKVQLHIEYADGSTEDLGTGPEWKAWTGPTLEADLLMGEHYDARLREKGMSDAVRQATEAVDVGAEMQPPLESHPAPPVRQFAEVRPKSITEVRPGVHVFNMGQNFAGVVRLRVSGTPGQRVTLRFAERLNPDGTVYTDNLRGARAIDTYVCRGDSQEVWAPRFTFHGFQYVEVSGLTKNPSAETITGIAISSDTPVTGGFACSDPMLERLASNILWTQRANFIDVPTDCPQRDERLGWTGDAQVYSRSACLNADVQAFFHKWLVDLTDAQRPDGQFPMVAPLKVAGDDGGPAWADAGVICPWTIYDVYGDRSVLEQHYGAMVRFVEFCRNRSTPELLPPEKFHCFGDWLNIEAETPKEVIATAYFARSTSIVAQAAEVLGKTSDAAAYRQLAGQIKRAFNRAYVDQDGHVRGKTQTGYVLALAFDLLDGETRASALRHLIDDIERRGWHLSTGFVGTKDLMLVLSAAGRNDVAYRLLQNVTFPSWGWTIKNGATSIWERWDGWTPEKGFQDPGMNSFAHYAFGAVYQWMVENIGGIRSDGPGFRRLIITPHPGGTLTRARVAYTSVNGRIATAWELKDSKMWLTLEIPPNATATVHLPGVGGEVLESGLPAGTQPGIRQFASGIAEVGSGTYEFVYPFVPSQR